MVEEQAILSVGTLVRGRYAIKSVLGSGSTGAVYLVKDQKNQELQYNLQALKEIRVLDQQTRYHFTIGGTPLRQLQYPALPRVHTLFNDDKRGCVYVLMDYAEGESLADLPWGHLTWPELRIWCEPLIAALGYLHRQEQPLFHGDLKPANLVRNRSGKIMLVDLGYVPQPGNASQPNRYRAPEQFLGTLDERSDVYGCGALLYTLLTGEEPVDALTRRERVSKRKTDSLILANKLSADIPRSLADVLQRALALEPAERFASVKEFWDALSPLAMALDIHPSGAVNQNKQAASPPISQITPPSVARVPASPFNRGSGSSRRGLLPIIAVVAALFLLLLSAGAWFWGTMRNHTNQPGTGTSNVSGTSISGSSTSGSGGGKYPHIVGRYSGTFTPVGAPSPVTFTLIINQQQQQQFSGNFISTVQKRDYLRFNRYRR